MCAEIQIILFDALHRHCPEKEGQVQLTTVVFLHCNYNAITLYTFVSLSTHPRIKKEEEKVNKQTLNSVSSHNVASPHVHIVERSK